MGGDGPRGKLRFLLDQVSDCNRLDRGLGAEWSDPGGFEGGAGRLCLPLDVGWGGAGRGGGRGSCRSQGGRGGGEVGAAWREWVEVGAVLGVIPGTCAVGVGSRCSRSPFG